MDSDVFKTGGEEAEERKRRRGSHVISSKVQ
jgi:hypothetical protein